MSSVMYDVRFSQKWITNTAPPPPRQRVYDIKNALKFDSQEGITSDPGGQIH